MSTSARIVLRKASPVAEVESLFRTIAAKRGIRRVEVTQQEVRSHTYQGVERKSSAMLNVEGLTHVNLLKGQINGSSGTMGKPKHAEGTTRALYFTGTETAVAWAKSLVLASGLESIDGEHGDHDHEACIRNAAKMGVPAEWAHRPETYLSM